MCVCVFIHKKKREKRKREIKRGDLWRRIKKKRLYNAAFKCDLLCYLNDQKVL